MAKISEMTDEEMKECYEEREKEKERRKRIQQEVKSEKIREEAEKRSIEYKQYLRENKEQIKSETKEAQREDWFWMVIIFIICPIAIFGGDFGGKLAIIMVIPTAIILIINHNQDNKRIKKIEEL